MKQRLFRALPLASVLLSLSAMSSSADAENEEAGAARVAGAVCQLLSLIGWPVTSAEVGPPLASLSVPDTVPSSEPGEVVIGILGFDPTVRLLEEFVRGRSVGRAPLRVERFEDSADVTTKLVYVATSERAHLDRVLETFQQKEIASISTLPEFLTSGGTIEVQMGEELSVRANGKRLRDLGLTLERFRPNLPVARREKEESCTDG